MRHQIYYYFFFFFVERLVPRMKMLNEEKKIRADKIVCTKSVFGFNLFIFPLHFYQENVFLKKKYQKCNKLCRETTLDEVVSSFGMSAGFLERKKKQ